MGGVSRSFRRISDRSGDAAKIGDTRFFERDPGSNWIACDGRALALTAENKKIFPPDSGSLSSAGMGGVASDSPPNIRGAILGDTVIIPLRDGTIQRSPNRGVGWGATLSVGSGNNFADSVAFGAKFVVGLNGTFRISSDGGINWSLETSPTVNNRRLIPNRMKVIGGALYAISANGREIFRTTDLSTWLMFDLLNSGIDFANEQGVADFDYDPVAGEWIFMTHVNGNRQGFYSSRDLVTMTRIGSVILDGYMDYLNYTGGLWIAIAANGSRIAVRRSGGVFVAKSDMYLRCPPVWTGAEFVSGFDSNTLGVSYDMEAFSRKSVNGFSNNSPVYFVYQFADGDLLAAQTFSTNNQRFALSRAVRAPTPPAIRPGVAKGKPYMRVR